MDGIENDGGEFSDDESSYDFDDHLAEHMAGVRDEIARSDPNLTKLTVLNWGALVDWEEDDGEWDRPGRFFSFDDDWEEDGERVGENTRIEELEIVERGGEDDEDIPAVFFSGIAQNRSIRKIALNGLDFRGDEQILSTLVLFLEKNSKLECLAMHNCGGAPNIALALVSFGSLKEFEFDYANFPPEGNDPVDDVLQALTYHARLSKLRLYRVPMGRRGAASLSAMLGNRWSRLNTLDLSQCEINSDMAVVIAKGLSNNRSVKTISLASFGGFSAEGWIAMLNALQCRQIQLEEMTLIGNFEEEKNDDGINVAIFIASYLASGNSTRSLKLCNRKYLWDLPGKRVLMTTAVWQGFFAAIQRRESTMVKLDLSSNSFGEHMAMSFAKASVSSGKLRELDLSSMGQITATEWESSLAILVGAASSLEKLNISSNSIDDDAVMSLANALIRNTTLQALDLSGNKLMSVKGLEALSFALQNPNSALEILDVSGVEFNDKAVNSLKGALIKNNRLKELNLRASMTAAGVASFSTVLKKSALVKLNLSHWRSNITDSSLISLAGSLAKNEKLKELILWVNDGPDVTAAAWTAVSRLLCDTSSILATFCSNHTLQKLSSVENDQVPEDIRLLLQLNRENSRSQAARAKVIRTHFREGFIVWPFTDMNTKLMPQVISWMGRSGGLCEHCYEYLKSVPSLFNVEYNEKKRKREH